MRVTIYDKHPGSGIGQWFLKVSWAVGCWLQKLFGMVDAYHGASSWDDASAWLAAQPGKFSSIQYWGHGSPGDVWLDSRNPVLTRFDALKGQVNADTVIWFRTCSTFQGLRGHAFSEDLSNRLGCTIAGHTRIIGLLQGGLHTRKPGTLPSWPVSEGEFPKSWLPAWAQIGNNTVFCLTTRIPKGW